MVRNDSICFSDLLHSKGSGGGGKGGGETFCTAASSNERLPEIFWRVFFQFQWLKRHSSSFISAACAPLLAPQQLFLP